ARRIAPWIARLLLEVSSLLKMISDRELKRPAGLGAVRAPEEWRGPNADEVDEIHTVEDVEGVHIDLQIACRPLALDGTGHMEQAADAQIELQQRRAVTRVSSHASGSIFGHAVVVVIGSGRDIVREAGAHIENRAYLESTREAQRPGKVHLVPAL